MRKLSQCFIILFVILLFSNTAFCDHKIGFSPKYCFLSIDDPDGNTDTYSGLQAIGLTYTFDLNRKSRLYTDFLMLDFQTSASTTEIANTAEGYSVTTAYQQLFRLSRNIKFFIGAGVTMTQIDFSERHTITESGFLQNSYEDRSENSFAAYVNVSNEWEINDNFDFGVNVAYQQDIGESVSGLSVGASVFYKFGR